MTLGWGLLSRFFPFRYFPFFSALPKYMLAIEYHVHIWQVSPQLSCGDSCQIWMWCKESNRYLDRVENFSYGKLTNGALVTPTPRLEIGMLGLQIQQLIYPGECTENFIIKLILFILPHMHSLSGWYGHLCELYQANKMNWCKQSKASLSRDVGELLMPFRTDLVKPTSSSHAIRCWEKIN